MTTVLLVDDQALVRAGFRMILQTQDDLEVVGEASSGVEAVRLARQLNPDVILMDVRMDEMDGIEATRTILATGSTSRVLILTTFDLDEYVNAALQAGVSGFLLKDVPPQDLITGIRAVASGDAIVAPSTTRRLLDQLVPHLQPRPNAAQVARFESLTAREREVLLEIASGKSNADIAAHLHISEGTVKTHVGRILTKLDLRDRVQAVVYAYENRLVTPNSKDAR